MYIPKQKLLQLARDVHSEIRIFYDNPKNIEKFNAWKRERIRKQGQNDLK